MFQDFPRPLPPFDLMWMEYRIPSMTFSEGKHFANPLAETARRVGCLVTRHGDAPGKPADIVCGLSMAIVVELLNGNLGVCPILLTGLTDQFECIGVVPNDRGRPTYLYPYRNEESPSEDEQSGIIQVQDETTAMSYPIFLALSLLNCRNVAVKTVKVDEKLIRARAKRGRPYKLAEHSVIEIGPIQKSVKDATGSAGYSREAAHIVRGHFKDFRNGAGLFGKYKGLYWWDQQLHAGSQRKYTLKDSVIGGKK